jgi:hypothetical protein
MKPHAAAPSKGKAAFELKHRLVQALNKVGDRDGEGGALTGMVAPRWSRW